MDVSTNITTSSDGATNSNNYICTGSKDKTLTVTPLHDLMEHGHSCSPTFRSRVHQGTVSCVQMRGSGRGGGGSWEGSKLVASASDDGSVVLHDFMGGSGSGVVAKLEGESALHVRPHSVVWHPEKEFVLMTAGYDDTIHVLDIRYLPQPIHSFRGHVPSSTRRCRRIHRPSFFLPPEGTRNHHSQEFILSGGEGSHCLSMFQCNFGAVAKPQMQTSTSTQALHHDDPYRAMDSNEGVGDAMSLYSRGALPQGCGDANCISIRGSKAVVATASGEILVLEPS